MPLIIQVSNFYEKYKRIEQVTFYVLQEPCDFYFSIKWPHSSHRSLIKGVSYSTRS